jgi:hypothetical protein
MSLAVTDLMGRVYYQNVWKVSTIEANVLMYRPQ